MLIVTHDPIGLQAPGQNGMVSIRKRQIEGHVVVKDPSEVALAGQDHARQFDQPSIRHPQSSERTMKTPP